MFVNLTPQPIVIEKIDSTMVTLEPSGISVRCKSIQKEIGVIDGVKIFETALGDVENLPEPEDGKIYIVPGIVLQACKGVRNDVMSPTQLIRDKNGNVKGCGGLTI